MLIQQKLTKSFIDKIETPNKDTIYWDSDLRGFGLKVTPTGRKVFIVQHRPKGLRGSAKKYTIGKYGNWTVHNARERAQDVLRYSNGGVDLGAKERAAAMKQSSDIVSSLIEDFLVKYAERNRTCGEIRRNFNKDIIPVIGNKSIHAVTKTDINNIIDRVFDRGSHIMANRTLAIVRKFLNWCISRGIIDISPANGVSSPANIVSRDRVLTKDETLAILNAAKQIGHPFGTIVQLLFITAQRRDEVAGMQWKEFDLDKRDWTIPAERAKNGKAHDVYLSKWAVELLSSTPRFALADDNVSDFAFTTTGTTSVSGFSKAKKKLDKLSGVTGWRLHDIRRTVVTRMSEMGVAIHVAEAILNHKSGTVSGVVATYNRNEFKKERQKALKRWSKNLRKLTS